MKKRGIINQTLSYFLAGLGHGDTFLLCDAGFPIPKEIDRIDLALTFGIPSMVQCIESILDEVVIQKVTIAMDMKEWNIEGYKFVKDIFVSQSFEEISQNELLKKSHNVKFIVRSGELGCYSNILLETASGVDQFKRKYVINPFDQEKKMF